MKDKTILNVSEMAYNVEKSTEAPLTFLIHTTALLSGVLDEDEDARISFRSGRSLRLSHCK